MNQLKLIEGMKTKPEPFHNFKGQCKICRRCGGDELETKTKAWSNADPMMCYCIKNDWCLDVYMQEGEMRFANGHGAVECEGVGN